MNRLSFLLIALLVGQQSKQEAQSEAKCPELGVVRAGLFTRYGDTPTKDLSRIEGVVTEARRMTSLKACDRAAALELLLEATSLLVMRAQQVGDPRVAGVVAQKRTLLEAMSESVDLTQERRMQLRVALLEGQPREAVIASLRALEKQQPKSYVAAAALCGEVSEEVGVRALQAPSIRLAELVSAGVGACRRALSLMTIDLIPEELGHVESNLKVLGCETETPGPVKGTLEQADPEYWRDERIRVMRARCPSGPSAPKEP